MCFFAPLVVFKRVSTLKWKVSIPYFVFCISYSTCHICKLLYRNQKIDIMTLDEDDISFCDDLSLVLPLHWLLLEQFIFAPLISGTTYEIYIGTAEKNKSMFQERAIWNTKVLQICAYFGRHFWKAPFTHRICENIYFTNLTWLFKWILAWVKNNLIKSWFLRRVGHWFIVWKVKWRAPGLRRKFGHKFTHIFYFHHFC